MLIAVVGKVLNTCCGFIVVVVDTEEVVVVVVAVKALMTLMWLLFWKRSFYTN